MFRSWYKTFVSAHGTPLGRRVQEAREAAGFTRAELAEHAQSTESAIRLWENGEREPRLKYLKRIADATERPLAWFFEEVAA